MHGVNRITQAEEIMLVNYSEVDAALMPATLNALAEAGVVVDMISQAAPFGSKIRFGFTAPYRYFETVIRTIGGEKDKASAPMVSGGYTKLNLFGEEMVESVGVAARALDALAREKVEIAMVTTSDLDISLLVRQEDGDVALEALTKAFAL